MAVLTHSQLQTLWVTAGGSGATADTAAAIAQAESGGDTSRINNTAYPNLPGYHPPSAGALREYSVGLWQINELAHPQFTTTSLLTPVGNANAAVRVWLASRSFSPWSTYTSGAYRQFLQGGGEPAPQPGDVLPGTFVVQSARAFSGWSDLRQSVNHHLPNQLANSKRARQATLRMLTHRHKVRGETR